MAARSRNGVRMMTRTITTHPKVNWKELESGKLWKKKGGGTGAWQAREKKNTYTYILTLT
jgi:hypothetical protein